MFPYKIPYDVTYKWNLINKTNKQQNITRDIEIRNNLTVTRGEMGGVMGRKRGRVFKKNCKGHMDKTKSRGWNQGREVRWLGWRREWWEENGNN